MNIETDSLSKDARKLILAIATMDSELIKMVTDLHTKRAREEQTTVVVEILHTLQELLPDAYWRRLKAMMSTPV